VQFEWDPAKNVVNLARHGIDFEDAVAIFGGQIRKRLIRAGITERSELLP